jgi:RNA recognition motif-containing protein
VGNVTKDVNEVILKDLFKKFGRIESVRMFLSKNFAFVTFSTVEEATKAKEVMDNFNLGKTVLRVRFGKV